MKPITLFYNYQTFVAGVLALGGAAWTVIAIRAQIKQSDRQENERRFRRNLAARAMMPAALAEICRYSEASVRILRSILPSPSETLFTGEIPEVPQLPAQALFTLKESIEFGNEEVAHNIADLTSFLQVQHSRINDVRSVLLNPESESVLRANLVIYIIDSLEAYARATTLFSYARRETDIAPAELNEEDIQKAAHACGIWDDGDEIFIGIKRLYGVGGTRTLAR